jgi:hypothetical protein
MSTDVNPAFLGCDEGQAGCAIPHAPGTAVLPEISPVPPPATSAPEVPATTDVLPGAGGEPRGCESGTRLARQGVDAGLPSPSPSAAVRVRPGQARWVGPVEPERPVMEILFLSLEGGRRYYSVRLNGQEIFVGTRPECDRFLELHEQKVTLEQAEARRVPRARPFPVRTFRAARA